MVALRLRAKHPHSWNQPVSSSPEEVWPNPERSSAGHPPTLDHRRNVASDWQSVQWGGQPQVPPMWEEIFHRSVTESSCFLALCRRFLPVWGVLLPTRLHHQCIPQCRTFMVDETTCLECWDLITPNIWDPANRPLSPRAFQHVGQWRKTRMTKDLLQLASSHPTLVGCASPSGQPCVRLGSCCPNTEETPTLPTLQCQLTIIQHHSPTHRHFLSDTTYHFSLAPNSTPYPAIVLHTPALMSIKCVDCKDDCGGVRRIFSHSGGE